MRRPLPAPLKQHPLTNAATRCRRVGSVYVDILGFTSDQLAARHAWCQAQAGELAPAVRGVPISEVERLLVEDWDLSAAEVAWILEALPNCGC
jgi:hypothetical protein